MSQAIGVTYADQEHPFYTLLSFTNSYSLSQKEREITGAFISVLAASYALNNW